MIDFGLKPCPMCGGEATVEQLYQSPEEQRAVIKCSSCGLSLTWETEIKAGVSRSGKRSPAKVGLDPIEAWNRRHDCETCTTKEYSDMLYAMHNCNDCGATPGCQYLPTVGQLSRFNCPHWKPVEEKA